MKRPYWIIAIIMLGFMQFSYAALGDQSYSVKAISMGKAFTAITDGVTGLVWNPASIAKLEQLEISSSSFDLFGLGLNGTYLAGCGSINRTGFGFAYTKVSDSVFPYKESTLSMILARAFSKINVGAGLNLYQLESYENGWGLGFSIGFLYEYNLTKGSLNFGLKADNLFSNISYTTGTTEELESLPTIGVAYINSQKVLIAMDVNPEELNLGLRYFLSNNFSCQVGLNNGKTACGFTMSKSGWELDYAYLTHNLGNSNRISINKRF
jgi:hypothetical protein